MHVLHATTTFPRFEKDHWGPFIRQLAESITRAGPTVEMLAARPPRTGPVFTPFKVSRFDYFLGPRWQTLVAPPGLIPNLKRSPWRGIQIPFFYRALDRAIVERASRADVVHAHWLAPAGLAAVRRARVPVVATAWGAEYHAHPCGPLGCLVRYTQQRADRIVAVSHYLRRRAIERFGADPKRIEVIPNAVDAQRFRPDRESDFRATHGIPEDHVLVVTARRLVPEKRVEDFIEAAAILCRAHERVTFLVAGDGPQRPALQRRSRDAGLGARIRFAGALSHDQLPDLLAAADLFVLTTAQEGLATALLEAMAAGAAPVATDGTGNDEAIVHGTHGLLYPTGDANALASRLNELITNHEHRQSLATAARQRVRAEFDCDAVAHQYLALYHNLITRQELRDRPRQ